VKRDGYWRFCRRVPQEFAELDKRGIVQQSTKIRSRTTRAACEQARSRTA
jgi:hypothetical protein